MDYWLEWTDFDSFLEGNRAKPQSIVCSDYAMLYLKKLLPCIEEYIDLQGFLQTSDGQDVFHGTYQELTDALKKAEQLPTLTDLSHDDWDYEWLNELGNDNDDDDTPPGNDYGIEPPFWRQENDYD